MKNNTIVFCDFDGTITYKDSFTEFIKFSCGSFQFYVGFIILSPLLILMKLGLTPNNRVKETVLKYFYKGLSKQAFSQKSEEFSLNRIEKILIPKALEKLNWHKQQKHKVVIVSASIKDYLEPWCKQKELELLSTELETENNSITGKLKTKNCFGVEKVNRINEAYNLDFYNEIYAYGDTKGDLPMLELATKPNYRVFN